MILKVFSPCLYSPEGVEEDVERRTISGGEALSGAEDVIATDGGGRWFAEYTNAYLDEPEIALAWRALKARLAGGYPVIVMFCDARHQPTAGLIDTLHSDGTPFSDESEYAQEDAEATLSADAALRATTLVLDIAYMPRRLLGGEKLAIDHPVHRWRPYSIAEIIEQDDDSATVLIDPPLREAAPAGTRASFRPRCVMRLDGDMRSPLSLGYAEGSVRFVEHFPGPGGY